MLDRQLLAAGASKTEHVVHLTLNPAQTFLYQALLKVWGSVDALSRVLYQSVWMQLSCLLSCLDLRLQTAAGDRPARSVHVCDLWDAGSGERGV